MRRIVYVTGEAAPFAVSGGLGDVMGALPRAVKRAGGREFAVSVILPLYGAIGGLWRSRMRRIYEGRFSLAWRDVKFSVMALKVDGVEYCFIENERYFDRTAMYGEFDDGERFAFFGRAVLEFLAGASRVPDVLHLNDWQTALVAVYLRTLYAADRRFFGVRTVLTVHNMEYQGRYDPAILSDIFDLHPTHRDLVTYGDSLNLLKGGLVTADRVTTVSPRHACELCDPAFGTELFRVVSSLSPPIVGILNGVDGRCFSPKDPALSAPYGIATVTEGKAGCKRAFLKEQAIVGREGHPLLAMVTRLVHAKGIDLVTATADRLLSLGATLVILGTGEERYERELLNIASRHPEGMRVILRFDRELSRRLYAAADLFLMPSRFEPCGIAQMIACRYGAIPVVRAVGGLADSIRPYGAPDGTGFLFAVDSAEVFFDAVADAMALYRAADGRFDMLRRAAMRADFSWRRAAAKYLSLYSELWEGNDEKN